MMDRLVVVIEAGDEREHAFCAWRKAGYRVVLLTGALTSRYESSADEVVAVDTNSYGAVAGVLRHIVEQQGRSAVLLTLTEWFTESVAKLAEELELVGNPTRSVKICRNKLMMRQRMASAGVPVPRFASVESGQPLDDAVGRVGGLPCIVKPVDDSGSRNVSCESTLDELTRSIRRISSNTQTRGGQRLLGRALVEEYLDGREFSVDGVVWRDKAVVYGISEVHTTPGRWFVKRGVDTPAPLTSTERLAIERLAGDAVAAAGLTVGGFHCEIILAANGPRLVELAPRLASNYIPELVSASVGRDLYLESVEVLAGQSPHPVSPPTSAASMRKLFAATGGTVEAIMGADEAMSVPGATLVDFRVGPGGRLPHEIVDRQAAYGAVVAVGETSAEAARRANEMARRLKPRVR